MERLLTTCALVLVSSASSVSAQAWVPSGVSTGHSVHITGDDYTYEVDDAICGSPCGVTLEPGRHRLAIYDRESGDLALRERLSVVGPLDVRVTMGSSEVINALGFVAIAVGGSGLAISLGFLVSYLTSSDGGMRALGTLLVIPSLASAAITILGIVGAVRGPRPEVEVRLAGSSTYAGLEIDGRFE